MDSKSSQSIFGALAIGLKCARLNWKIIILLFFISVVFGLIGSGPILNTLEAAVQETQLAEKISNGFDYTIWTEIIREHKTAIKISVTVMFSFFIPYLLWLCFAAGGIMTAIHRFPRALRLQEFWSGGAFYFFKYLRLLIFTIIALALISILCYGLFSAGGLSPFVMDSERPLILKFKLLSAIWLFLLILIGLASDLAKINIAKEDSKFIHKSILHALRQVLNIKNVLLVLMFLLIILILFALTLMLKKVFASTTIIFLLWSQLVLLIRIALKFTRLASLNAINSTDEKV